MTHLAFFKIHAKINVTKTPAGHEVSLTHHFIIMESSKIAAVILAVGATAAGLTFYISHQQSQSSSDPAATQPEHQLSKLPRECDKAPSLATRRPEASLIRTFTSSSSAASVTPPNGIDQDTWDRAIRNTKMIYGMAQQARESGWMEHMIEGRVKGDAKMISDQLGLDEPTATKIETMLLDRANGSLEQTRKVWDAMLADEAKFTEMAAIRDMKEREVELSPELAARDQALRQEVFGQFAEGRESPSATRIFKTYSVRSGLKIGMKMMPSSSKPWLKCPRNKAAP